MNVEVISSILNFSVVIFVLVYFGRQPILAFFQQRSSEIGAYVSEAKKLSDQSRALLSSWEQRRNQAEAEMKQLQKDAETSLAKYREAVLERARMESERIAEDTQQVLAAERVKAKKSLQQQVASESLEQARRYLQTHVESKDSRLLLTEYLERVADGHTS